MKASDYCINELKNFEAFSAEPYNDEGGNATIGYGHLLHKGSVKESEKSMRWTLEEADARLRERLAKFEEAINFTVRVALNQNQFDALLLWVYNCGIGAMQASSWLRAINAGNYGKVPALLQLWNKVRNGKRLVVSRGLCARRQKEADLFKKKA